MSTVKASELAAGDVITRVVDDPGYPGEHICSGEVAGIRRLVPGFVTLDFDLGAMTLSEAAVIELDDTEDEDICPDTGEHPLARCAVEGCQNYRDELEALAPAWTSGRGLKGWA